MRSVQTVLMDLYVFFGSIYLTGVLIGLLLIGVCVVQSGKPIHKKTLIALLMIFCLILLDGYLINMRFYTLWPHFAYASAPFWYAVAPLIYLLFASAGKKTFKVRWVDLLHLLPLFIYVFLHRDYFLADSLTKIEVIDRSFDLQAPGVNWMMILFYAQNILYISGLLLPGRANSIFKSRFVPILYLYGVIIILDASGMVLRLMGVIDASYLGDITTTVYTVLIYFLAYRAITSPNYLEIRSPIHKRYAASGLDKEGISRLSGLTRDLIVREKLFLKKDLKLQEIAAILDVNKVQLSEAINKGFGYNFNMLVNRSRVNYALDIIANENFLEKYDMNALALKCGFSNAVTFYRNFKTVTGRTPAGYLRRQEAHENPVPHP